MDTSQSLRYEPLQGSEVRLITIKPGPFEHPIECRFEHISLDERPQFVALSYVWGHPKDTVSITLNDVEFHVTWNLYHALHQMREWVTENSEVLKSHFSPGNAYFFWIDAICLNQADDDEKMKQIPRMHDIYSMAALVCGWMGLPDEGDENMMELIFSKGRQMANYPFMEGSNFAAYPQMLHELVDILPAFVENFTKVVTLPWFSRIWILQEAVLSQKDPLLIFGRNYCQFAGLAIIHGTLIHGREDDQFNRNYQTDAVLRKAYGIVTIHQIRQCYQDKLRSTSQVIGENDLPSVARRLLAILKQKTPECQCTLNHDTIYGVLGIAGPLTLPEALAPDYRKPYSLVCQQYARFLMENTGDLTILSGDGIRFENERSRVPSWVPDFRFPSHYFIDPPTYSRILFSPDGKQMSVQGVSLGICTRFLQPTRIEPGTIDPLEQLETRILAPASNIKKCSLDIMLDEWLESWITAPYNLSIATLRKHYDVAVKRQPLIVTCPEDIFEFEAQKGEVCRLMDNIETHLRYGYVVLSERGLIGIMINCTTAPCIGDLLCVLKGSTAASLLRPYGAMYEFIGSCDLRCSLSNIEFDDPFFSRREVDTFILI